MIYLNNIKWLRLLVFTLMLGYCSFLSSQQVNLKSNLLYDATSTLNLGLEIGLGKKFTLDLSGNYNPWEFGGNKKMKHFLVQPELRFWPCEKFYRWFWGLHGHYAGYNVGGISAIGIEDRRYEGTAMGFGVSVGRQWVLNKRWSIEASFGVGYALLDYDKYPSEKCAKLIEEEKRNYVGPTKISVSIIYFIK